MAKLLTCFIEKLYFDTHVLVPGGGPGCTLQPGQRAREQNQFWSYCVCSQRLEMSRAGVWNASARSEIWRAGGQVCNLDNPTQTPRQAQYNVGETSLSLDNHSS